MAWNIPQRLGLPWIYSDLRYSQGKLFTCFKIRTMRIGMEALQPSTNSRRKNPNDSRILPSRQWMRRVGFDELPQLYNVFRGEMAIFGPRPLNHSDWMLLSNKQRRARALRKAGCFGPYSMLREHKNDDDLMVANDALIRLLSIKEKQGRRSIVQFRTFILIATVKAILQGKVH
jgi:lipopolysaccharide/colanic/teichoic acid biosynthesis glycosyltransferase